MLREEKGAVAVIIAILIVVFFGFAALVIDVGALYEERRQNQTVADAAALAGAQELPDNPNNAVAKAIDYADFNHRAITASAVQITKTYVDNDTIKVTVKSTVNYTFAAVLGFSSGGVSANATAIVGSPITFGGTKLMPWARMDEPFNFGQEYILFRSADPSTGNFQAIQLPYIDPVTGNVEPSPGLVEYADLVAGQDNKGQPIIAADVSLHQILETKTGNFGVNTKNALDIRLNGDTHAFSDVVDSDGHIIDYDCPRIIVIVSVVNPMGTVNMHSDDTLIWPTGTSSPVEVERFNYFFIKGYVSKPSEGDYVTGIFIRHLTAEEARVGAYDPKSGMRIVKLFE
jgi:Flp pilus assembly protein TadG